MEAVYIGAIGCLSILTTMSIHSLGSLTPLWFQVCMCWVALWVLVDILVVQPHPSKFDIHSLGIRVSLLELKQTKPMRRSCTCKEWRPDIL